MHARVCNAVFGREIEVSPCFAVLQVKTAWPWAPAEPATYVHEAAHRDALMDEKALMPSVIHTTNPMTMSSGCQLKKSVVELCRVWWWPVVSIGPNANPPRYACKPLPFILAIAIDLAAPFAGHQPF